MNQRKGKAKGLLDPFEVQDAWFEIDLPSLNLRLTPATPASLREQATRTLETLDLVCGRAVMRLREHALQSYRGGLDRGHLVQDAPMLMRAIDRLVAEEESALSPARLAFRRDLQRERERSKTTSD